MAQPRDRRVITAAAPVAGAPRGEGIVVRAVGQAGRPALQERPARCPPPAGASPMCSLGTRPRSEGPVAQVVWSLPGPLCPLVLGWPLPGTAGGWLSPHPGNGGGLTPPPHRQRCPRPTLSHPLQSSPSVPKLPGAVLGAEAPVLLPGCTGPCSSEPGETLACGHPQVSTSAPRGQKEPGGGKGAAAR